MRDRIGEIDGRVRVYGDAGDGGEPVRIEDVQRILSRDEPTPVWMCLLFATTLIGSFRSLIGKPIFSHGIIGWLQDISHIFPQLMWR